MLSVTFILWSFCMSVNRISHICIQNGEIARKPGALILVDGFIQNRQVKSKMICSQCGVEYLYDDAATEMIPYAVEYLAGHLTDEEIALTAGYKAGKELREAEAAIFG